MDSLPSNDLDGTKLVAVDVVFTVVAILSVIARWVAIRLRRRTHELYDWLIYPALLFAIGLAVTQIIGCYLGYVGLHIDEVEAIKGERAQEIASQTLVAAAFLWALATWLTKMSILVLYQALFPNHKWFKWLNWIWMATVSAFCAGIIITQLALCSPIRKEWQHSTPGHCGSQRSSQIASAVVNFIIDMAIVIMPMKILWGLQMPRNKKIALTGIFSLGFAICVLNIVRIIRTLQADWQDFTYSVTDSALYAGLEVDGGIVVACVPTLRPLFSKQARYSRNEYLRHSYGAAAMRSENSENSSSQFDPLNQSNKSYRITQDDIALEQSGVRDGAPRSFANKGPLARVHERELGRDVIGVQTDLEVFASPLR